MSDTKSTTDSPEQTTSRTRRVWTTASGSVDTLRSHYDDLSTTLPWSLDGSQRTGARLGNALTQQVRLFVLNVLLLATRFVPLSQRFWRGVLQAGITGLHKTAGGDAINFVVDQGRIRPEPVKFDRGGSDSPVDDPRWIDQHGNFWKSPDEAKSTYLMGKIPVVWSSSKGNELGTHVQAEVAELLDLGKDRELYESATVSHVKMKNELPNGDPSAVADGGVASNQWQEYVTVEDPGTLSDVLVDLNEGLAGGDAGRVVSMEKFYEVYPSTPGSEEMQTQFMLGQLAERDQGAQLRFAMKVMLIALGVIAIVVLGPPIVSALFGGGGGGGAVGPVLGG